MVKNGAKDAFDIWYEWDKNIYEGDDQFPEFMNILKIAKANNLFDLGNVIKEQINLTDEEHSFLSQELTNIVKELYKDKYIDSAYMTNFQDSNHSRGTIRIIFLLKSGTLRSNYEYTMKKINLKIAKDNKTGINVELYCDYLNNYPEKAWNFNDIHRVEQLVESTILFDKTGQLNKVQVRNKGIYGPIFKLYLVDYVPPIDKTISLKLIK